MTAIEETDKIALEKLLISHLNEKEGRKLMSSLAKHWKDEGLQEGIERGIEKGIEKRTMEIALICSGKTLISRLSPMLPAYLLINWLNLKTVFKTITLFTL